MSEDLFDEEIAPLPPSDAAWSGAMAVFADIQKTGYLTDESLLVLSTLFPALPKALSAIDGRRMRRIEGGTSITASKYLVWDSAGNHRCAWGMCSCGRNSGMMCEHELALVISELTGICEGTPDGRPRKHGR